MPITIDDAKHSVVYNYVNKPTKWLNRHVKWLKQGKTAEQKLLKKVCLALEAILCIVTLVGIPILLKAWEIGKRIDSRKHFAAWAAQRRPPPENLQLELKTRKQTFNHIQEFVIHEGVIWVRRRGVEDKTWRPIYFDGFPSKVPQELHADGANLVVLDQDRRVHYKKVLHDYLKEHLTDMKNKRAVHGRRVVKELSSLPGGPKTYVALDKAFKDNWKKSWFTLPVLGSIASLFGKSGLKIPKGARGWAISQRGIHNLYYSDPYGKKHEVTEGVTTLYVLSPDGKSIKKYDPWSPPHITTEVPWPDEEGVVFEAEKISASSSTLMLLGYKITPVAGGKTHRELVIKTCLSDIDVEGWNPTISYSYFKSDNPKVRGIFFAPWEEHPLPPKGQFTGAISILQTGQGNDARHLRVEGTDEEGKLGIWHKSIQEKEWSFFSYPEQPGKLPPFLVAEEVVEAPFVPTVFSYAGEVKKSIFPLGMQKPLSFKLEGFGRTKRDALLTFEYEGKGVTAILHRTKGLAQFLGIGKATYDLILPKDFAGEEGVSKLLLLNQEKASVNLKMSKKGITILGLNFRFSLKRFL
jgi:hypothetical protein